jgi:hypothetical protein
MKFWAAPPSAESCENALRKGFGRAFIWAEAGYGDQSQLIDACLNDYRFDRQVEDARGDWLWRIVRVSAFYDAVREPVFEAIGDISSSDAVYQLCQLAAHFAKEGDDRFRLQLRRIVQDKPVADAPELGEEELLRIDGVDGFLLALRRHAADLRTREWDWYDGVLVDNANSVLGEQQVSDVLAAFSGSDEYVKQFAEYQRRELSKTPNAGRSAYSETLARLTADDIIAAAESAESRARSFRGWGRHASSADLERVLERMLGCENVKALQKYLEVFCARAMPRLDDKIFKLFYHENWHVQRRAATAIAQVQHPEARQFALEKLQEVENQEYAVEMLEKNYERGDEQLVLDSVVLPAASDQRHWLLKSLLDMVENNMEAECGRATKLIYDEMPCSCCRSFAVKLWANRGVLPADIRAECQFDFEQDTRALVGGPAWDELTVL